MSTLEPPPSPPSNLLLRPWQKFINPSSLSLPISLSEATYRLTQNLTYFLPNYLLLTLSIFLITLITRPLALVFFLCLLCAWVYLLSRGPITVLNYDIDFKYIIGVLTLVAVFWCNAWFKVFIAVVVGGLVVFVHAVLMAPVDDFEDTPYGSLLNSPVDGGYTSV